MGIVFITGVRQLSRALSVNFDPSKDYSAWVNPDKVDWDRMAHMRRMIPKQYRGQVEMIDKPGTSGWIYRPKKANDD